MQQLLIQQQLSRRSPGSELNKSVPMQSMASGSAHQQLQSLPQSQMNQQQQQPGNIHGECHNLNRTQQQLNAALFNTDSESLLDGSAEGNKYAAGNRNSRASAEEDVELHMAEQLVANADKHQKSAFQFDTIEPKGRRQAAGQSMAMMQDSGIGE